MVLMPMYWIRVAGGTLYLTGGLFCGVNLLKTWAARPAKYEETVHEAPALSPQVRRAAASRVASEGRGGDRALPIRWTSGCKAGGTAVASGDRCGSLMWVICSVVAASLFEVIPLFLIQSNIPTISAVKPYSPLELLGRDIYIENGCYNCHSQMIRPILAETKRYGEYSKGGESVYDHPFQWGSRRIGPDLARLYSKQVDARLAPSPLPRPARDVAGQIDHAGVCLAPGIEGRDRRHSAADARHAACWACLIRTSRSRTAWKTRRGRPARLWRRSRNMNRRATCGTRKSSP